jgi:hypothetical protein
MPCTHKDSCALFPVISLSSALKIWQTFYCDGKFETCLRYQRSLKGEKVAPNLLPNGKELDLVIESKPDRKPAPVTGVPATAAAAKAAPSPASCTGYYSYYLRFRIQNTPGLPEKIIQEIRKSGIGIDATITKPAPVAGARCLIIITDQGPELDLFQAILRIEALEGVIAKVKCIPLEKHDAMMAA